MLGVAHNGAIPPPALVQRWLEPRRAHFPRRVDHTFRHLYQAHAYWLEGHTWIGSQWDSVFHQRTLDDLNALRGDADPSPIIEAIHERLGRLRGTIDGQVITVDRKHIGEVTVWISPEMLNRAKPVTLIVDGEELFEGLVRPDLHVCLNQAARAFDFERLRWAGLRVGASGEVTIVTGATPSPSVVPESYD